MIIIIMFVNSCQERKCHLLQENDYEKYFKHFGSKVLVTLSYVRICYYTNMPVTISVGEVSFYLQELCHEVRHHMLEQREQ